MIAVTEVKNNQHSHVITVSGLKVSHSPLAAEEKGEKCQPHLLEVC